MIRWSDRAVAALACVALGACRVAAQTPTARDTTRRDSVRADSARAAAARHPVIDSTARDSIVADQLQTVRRRERQSIFERLHFDWLRLTELGVLGGIVFPDQVRSAPLYAVRADYGEIVPDVRVVVGATYWTSRYTDQAVAGFSEALGRVAGRAPGDSVPVGLVRSSDVALNAEARWRPGLLGTRRGIERVRPWVGLGAGAHFINVQNPAIDGTFVARALDGVAFGPTAALGIDLLPLRTVQLTAEARYDLFNGARYGSIRAGGSYVFEPRRAQ